LQKIYLLLIIGLFLTACNDGDDAVDNNESNETPVSVIDINETYLTGQYISYHIYDDGYYKAGVPRRYIKYADSVRELTKGVSWQDDAAISERSYTQDEAALYCYDLELNGFDDWRLPTLEESFELIDYGKANPALSNSFTNNATGYFWTQTPCPVCNEKAFAIAEANGVFYSQEQTNEFHVRCVRGYEIPKNNFVRDDSLEVVIDKNKNLMWQDGNVEAMETKVTFSDALDYCANLVFAGYDDWRIPNVIELRLTFDFSGEGNDGLLNVNFQQRLINSWSSTTDAQDVTDAWSIEYYLGVSLPTGKEKFLQKRCVRSIVE